MSGPTYIHYCDTMYGGNIIVFDRRLGKAQNRIAGMITGTSRRTSPDVGSRPTNVRIGMDTLIADLRTRSIVHTPTPTLPQANPCYRVQTFSHL